MSEKGGIGYVFDGKIVHVGYVYEKVKLERQFDVQCDNCCAIVILLIDFLRLFNNNGFESNLKKDCRTLGKKIGITGSANERDLEVN